MGEVERLAKLREHLKMHPEELANAPYELDKTEDMIKILTEKLDKLKAYRDKVLEVCRFLGEKKYLKKLEENMVYIAFDQEGFVIGVFKKEGDAEAISETVELYTLK